LRNGPFIIGLLISLLVSASVQIPHVTTTNPTFDHMTSSDDVLPDWMQELQEHESFDIFSDTDFVDQGWPGNGSESDPFIIENLRIRAYLGAIVVWNTTSHFEIRRCHFTKLESSPGGGPAVNFRNVTNGRVTDNFINGTHYGVGITNSTDCEITDNSLDDINFGGIFVDQGHEILIAKNTIHNTNLGIEMEESTDFTIRDNRIYDCGRGLYLTDVQTGIIAGNRIWRNTYGVYLTIGHGIVTNNSIYANTEYGIRIDSGIASNMVYGNRIGWNVGNNAEDNSNSTGWDNGLGVGNSWSDYNGTGQYPVPGSSGSRDRWPLVLIDNVNPIIDSPSDMDFEFGSLDQSLTWNTSDEFPLTYQIMVDGLGIETGTWSGQTVMFLLNDFQPGTYLVTLRLWDAHGNYAADGASVYVAETEPPTIDHPPDIEYVVGELGNNITWWPVDSYPESFEIIINGTLYNSGPWSGSGILISVDWLEVGVYNFTLVVYDAPGQSAVDTVLVRVHARTSEPPPDTLGFVLFLLGVGMIGFAITFLILYTSTPYLARFRRGDDDDSEEMQEAIEELKEYRNDTTQDNDVPLESDDD